MKMAVGLGNPGAAYNATRHNIGYRVIDYLAQCHHIDLCTRHHGALLGRGVIAGCDVLLAKPETFMNLSGNSVRELASCYQLTAADIIVIHDDIDLEFGRIKIKTAGGSGGHRGVESICTALTDDTFVRVRIGIGRPPPEQNTTEFVLQPFADDEFPLVDAFITSAAQCLELVLNQGTVAAMNTFHKKMSFTPR